MRVLLITYSFPPAGGVGVLRALSLAKYLPEIGVEVEVLTARNAAAVGRDATLEAQIPAAVRVHRTWTPDLPFRWRKALKKMVSRSKPQGAGTTVASAAAPRRQNPVKALVANMLLPDPQVGWLPFAMRAARKVIRSRKIDVVLITVPPFSSVRLVTLLRRAFPELPIVLDFRDEWLTSTIHLVSFNSNERARRVASEAESEAVRDATAVVGVTAASVGELRKRYSGEPAEKFHHIPNGFDVPLPIAEYAPVQQTPVVLTYIGTVYGSSDPTNVVAAVLRLSPELRAKLRLRFVGHVEIPSLREALLELGDIVEMIGFLPQAEALAYVQRTSYLLLVTHDPINVPAKLYDYLGSGRPILAAVHPEGDARRTLDETRTGWWADVRDPAAIAELLKQAIERVPRLAAEFQPNREAVAGYHRRRITAEYAGLLRSVAGGGSA